jgi:RNA polymerase sigma-70 factor (ECF subfamily)
MSSEAIACLPQDLGDISRNGVSPLTGYEKTSVPFIEIEGRSNIDERGSVILVANSELSDENLMDQIRHGGKEALSVIFRRHARTVRNVAYRILRNEAEADDLVQDVFIFIFRKADQFDARQGGAASWIIRMAYHRAFDRRRYLNSRHFYTSQELDDTTIRPANAKDAVPFHERTIEGVLGRELTARFQSRLSAKQQETIQLYFFEGHTLREIADLTGESLVNVRSHYYRGLERLRKFVLPSKQRPK